MADLSFVIDARALIEELKSYERDLKSINQGVLSLRVINTAKDIGKPTSTNLYYYPFVDQGRGAITATNEREVVSRSGKKRTQVGLLFKKDAVTWIFKRSVKASEPLRISELTEQKIAEIFPDIITSTLEEYPGFPASHVIYAIMDKLKKAMLQASKDATDERVGKTPQSVGSGQRLRFYQVPAATISESFKIQEEGVEEDL